MCFNILRELIKLKIAGIKDIRNVYILRKAEENWGREMSGRFAE